MNLDTQIMNKIYTIYHIPEFVYSDGSIGKIGVSYKLTSRIKQNLKKSVEGFTNWEVLEEWDCKYKVSDREIELQKQYGYKVDVIPYWKTILNGLKQPIQAKQQIAKNMAKGLTKEQLSKNGKIGGKIAGKIALESGHMKRMLKLSNIANRKPIIQYDLDGNFIREWDYIKKAGIELGLHHQNISRVLKGKRKTVGGFVFKYK